jgi:hypothetical protein
MAAMLCTVSAALAAGGKLTGLVVDASSNTALAGVSITATGPMHAQTVTSQTGHFGFTKLVPGTYILITDLPGYGTAQTNGIPVGEGLEQHVTIALTRQSDTAAVSMGSNLTVPPPWFTYNGDVRAYYFGRTNGNSCLTCPIKGSPDAVAFNFGGTVHGQINIPYSPWAVGATYFGSYPFGTNWPGPLNNIGYNPLVDNTLPGYTTSLWGELYLQYKTAGMFGQSGKEVLTQAMSPWAHTSDSRIEPASFQGTLLDGNISPNLQVGGMYIVRFRSRVTSSFDANTLLTSCNTAFSTGKGPVEGVSGTFTVPGDSCNKLQHNQGFLEFWASYKNAPATIQANGYWYQMYNIATMAWFNAQWNFDQHSRFNPYVGAQFLSENNTGTALVGTVHNYTAGGIFGATIYHNLNFTAAYDGSPATTYIVNAKLCGSASSPKSASPGVIFGGVSDSTFKGLPPGDVACYGGGIASPYTDGYATDTLHTTQITQGMADTHLPGTGVKAALTWQSDNHRLRAIVSQAWYNYSLPGSSGGIGNGDTRAEFNFDVQYFFNPVRTGPYKGFSIRQRYADRTQTFNPYEFKYSRTQLEYTF